jgi:hypothetical protein
VRGKKAKAIHNKFGVKHVRLATMRNPHHDPSKLNKHPAMATSIRRPLR